MKLFKLNDPKYGDDNNKWVIVSDCGQYELSEVIETEAKARERLAKIKPRLVLEERKVYGLAKLYPVNREAKLFAEMLGVITLVPHKLEYISGLGYEIEITGIDARLMSFGPDAMAGKPKNKA